MQINMPKKFTAAVYICVIMLIIMYAEGKISY